MINLESQFINIIGLFLGFWLGGHLSRRIKGQAFVAVVLGFGMVFLSNQLLLPHAYVCSGSRHNNIAGYLAMAVTSMIFVTGAVPIKDIIIDRWVARRHRHI